jgi:hypothetical protein
MSLKFNPFTGTLDYLGNVSATGLNSLNGQTENSQTFSASASGTDFTISSLGGVHTFSLPVASATASGKLSSADWSEFKGHQQYKVENRILTTIEISNKYMVLAIAPTNLSKVTVSIIGGTEQANGVDFIMTGQDSGKRLSWNGTPLDGMLSAGDELVIRYF